MRIHRSSEARFLGSRRADVAAHRVFRFLDEPGFRPGSLHLERFLPGASDRYLLMMAVQRR